MFSSGHDSACGQELREATVLSLFKLVIPSVAQSQIKYESGKMTCREEKSWQGGEEIKEGGNHHNQNPLHILWNYQITNLITKVEYNLK